MEYCENVGGSSRGTDRDDRHRGDGWCRFASVRLSARDIENTHCGVVECCENVGGSSRSGRIVTTRHSGDRWCRFLSVRLLARDFENIYEGLHFSCNGICSYHCARCADLCMTYRFCSGAPAARRAAKRSPIIKHV